MDAEPTLNPPAEPAPELSVEVERTAFYLHSRNAPLFAWLHRIAAASQHSAGIVLCAPIGHEQVHAHRGLRHLADALARLGFSVVRFDYHGTGDSAGRDEDTNRVASWLDNIRDAMGWMKRELGCRHLSLFGLRLGAALATRIAEQTAVERLILWDPVVKGRQYVREMKLISLAAKPKPQPSPQAPDDLEVAGFVLSNQTIEDLNTIDLLASEPLCRSALIVARDDVPEDTRLADHFASLGIRVDRIVPPGYADLMAEPHETQVPHRAIDAIVAWMRGGLSGQTVPGPTEDPAWPTEAILASEPGNALRERAVRLCPDPNLFGIVCEPATPPSEGVASSPAILLCNGGSHYHTGAARSHVAISRALASQGFRCLRMDFHGHGDSVTSDLARENVFYPSTAFRDIDLAMKFLQREFGVRQIILIGHCAGAYFAFQSAAQLPDPGLAESILINPITFYWHERMTQDRTQIRAYLEFQKGMVAMRKPGKWLQLLTGRSKIGLRGALRHVLAFCKRRRPVRSSGNEADPAPFPSHPPNNDLPGDLMRIVEKGRRLTLFQARTDPGYDTLCCFAKSQVKKMDRAGQLKVYFFETADHNFHWLGPRRELLQALVAHLSARYLRVGIS